MEKVEPHKKICNFILEGKHCKFGTRCKFSHELQPQYNANSKRQLKASYKSQLKNLKISQPNQAPQDLRKQNTTKRQSKQEVIPQDDYRSLAINPTIIELNSTKPPVLREIRKDKGFDDLGHYLDVNFRLLKEDFTSELREGLQSYQLNPSQSNTQVNIYSNAKISGFFATKAFFGLKLRIFTRRGVMSWQTSRKLMYGGMLMFSDDRFKQRVAQCVIRDREGWKMDDTMRKHGYIEIDVEILIDEASPQNDAFSAFQSMFGKPIVILESKCYYEAYYHILKQLQEIKYLPFEECIVGANPNAITMPEYLNQVDDLDDIIDKKVISYTLDYYQEKAFRTAFSTNISLIQGPPGTGKTYIGEKIAQTMLELLQKKNGKMYDKKKRKMVACKEGLVTGPILLTCYTNHALDQFLEKISEYTQMIVRLGGGTKNENLKKFGLREVQRSRGFKQDQKFFDLRREQESIADKCIKLTNNYEHAHQVGTIDTESVKSYKLSLQKSLTPRAMEMVIYLLEQIETTYRDKEMRFLKSKPYDFKEYLNKTVKKQIQNPAIFEWLGILDLNFVFNKFQKDPKSIGDNQERYDDHKNNNANNAYLFEEQEIDHYAEIFEELRTASKQKAKIALLLQSQPLIFQDQGQKFKTYEELIQSRKSNIQMFDSNKDAVLFLNQTASQNLHHIDMDSRWRLNNLIVKSCEQVLEDQIRDQSIKIQQNIPILENYEVELNKKILQTSDVIAMTTTGAAKFKSLLSKVSSKIMIVEEAAQILEAHMTTSLTKDVEHMILIGDHEQLRPSLNVHRLSYLYNLDISMFERLINNQFENVMLRSQRRMRPEISEIVRQIYPGLSDYQTVKNFSNVKGINGRNYLFFHHLNPEDEIQGMMSKTNPKEADIIIRFVIYLIQQGYAPDQITVLSLYAGQLMCMKNKIARQFKQQEDPIRRVKIQTVDNYQGEENDIIILSLVRSNHNDNIGFLKASNRVCVALSRARKGMFIFGNADCLKSATLKINQNQEEALRQKHIWLRVLDVLEARGDVQESMELICTHGIITKIRKASDFDKVPEGGCDQICGVQMNCGHYCESRCHWYEITPKDETGHGHIVCTKRCIRPRKNCSHPCTYKCYECEDEHQPCMVEMSKTLECGHYNIYKCHEFHDNVKCQMPCEKILACGHACQKLCRFDCDEISQVDQNKGYTSSCKIKVLKKLPCGHEVMVDCGQPPEMHHKHNGCSMMLKKQLKCGHIQMIRCDTEPDGCAQIVQKELPCGHFKEMRCDQNPDAYFLENGCNVECTGILECGHQCPRNCGECFGNIFHGECPRKCININICGHVSEGNCNQRSPLCINPLRFLCAHKKNGKFVCGQIQEPCSKPCTYNCEHHQCTRLCSEICDREPCQYPCKKKLSCGHDCIGICGEKCPPVCRVKGCKNYKEQTFQVQFGNKASPNSKFILLEDCGHILESQALDKHIELKTVRGEIKYPQCPICKTTIRNCQRYQKIIKRTFQKIEQIKFQRESYVNDLVTKMVNQDFIELLKIRIQKFVKTHQPPQTEDTPSPVYSNLVQSIFDQMAKICKDSQYIQDNGIVQADEIQTYASKINCIAYIMSKVEEFEATEIDITVLFKAMEGLEKVFDQLSSGQSGNLMFSNKTNTWVTKFKNLGIHEDRIRKIECIVETFGLYIQILIGKELSISQQMDFPDVLIDFNREIWTKKFNVDNVQYDNLKQLVQDNIGSLGQNQAKEFQKLEMRELSLKAGLWRECPSGHLYPCYGQEGGVESQCPECDSKWTD